MLKYIRILGINIQNKFHLIPYVNKSKNLVLNIWQMDTSANWEWVRYFQRVHILRYKMWFNLDAFIFCGKLYFIVMKRKLSIHFQKRKKYIEQCINAIINSMRWIACKWFNQISFHCATNETRLRSAKWNRVPSLPLNE